MRSVNGIQLLNLIRDSGPLSRAMLARLSSLSKPTVSEQVNRLLAFGVAVETGQGEPASRGGKRPTMVAFNADAGRVAGIAIGPETTRIALANLQGDPQVRTEIRTSPQQGPRRLLERIERAVAGLAARDGQAAGAIRTVGVGVPGRVDRTAGIALEAGNLGQWNHVDLRTPLESRFGCPVIVDNDVNVALVAELYHGAAQNADTAVLVRAGTGIGAAVAMNRTIHHGSHWAAGEVGHLATDRPSRKGISPRGQLELVVGADQIRTRVRRAARKSRALRGRLREEGEISALFAADAEGDPVAAEIAADVSHHLSVAVAHQVLAYDPDVVILSGEIFQYAVAGIRRFLAQTVPWSPLVELSDLGEEGVLIGAVDTALISVYEQMSRQLHRGAAVAAGGRF